MMKSFDERCYILLGKVPKGRVTTYKELAKALGTRAYRAVGGAMKRNPYAPRVACHRVVKSDGSLGGFAYGAREKIKRLRDEGVKVRTGKIQDFERVFFSFGMTS